jgi:hypothetical protein
LAGSRDRIAGQPFPPAALLIEIDATVSAAGRLRDLMRASRPYHQLPAHHAPETRRLARRLRDAAAAAHRGGTGHDTGHRDECPPAAEAIADLVHHALTSTGLAGRAHGGRPRTEPARKASR